MESFEPTWIEINMDAEVGSYQDDFSDPPREPIAAAESDVHEDD